MSERFWDALETGAKWPRQFADDLWKIWRWFAVGILGFLAYELEGSAAAFVFGLVMSTIGVAALASWVFGGIDLGVTAKGRSGGRLMAVILSMGILLLSIYFAVQLWAISVLLALPVYSSG